MNKTFRSVWNASKQAYVAAAETVSAKGKPTSGVKVATVLASLMGSLLGTVANAQTAPPPNTLPTGGQVSAGNASINQSGAHMVINQSTSRAAINWQTFNVGKDAHVQFQQPNAASVTLNRVMSSDPSQIFGRISANGQVILTNPAGVYFGKDARVDVGGLVATTHGMSDADFMAGKSRYERNGATGSVVNEGELKAALGGYIALLAPEVRNQGAIIAQMGTVALAAGEAIDLKFDSNNRLTSLRVEPSQIAALVENKQAVQAPGGLVIISAQSMDRLLGGVVKNSGRIEAHGLQQQGGRIMLSASHKVDNSGSISANATASSTSADSGPAGKVEISAAEVINSGSITATGASSASNPYNAGSVLVHATNFTQTASGNIDLSAPKQGGQLKIEATGNVSLQGSVNAQATQDSQSTQGGQIDMAAQGDIEVSNATLDASGGQGGSIVLRAKAESQPDNPQPLPDAPGQGRLAIMGNSTLSTRGRSGKGGSTTLLGDQIDLLDTTRIDATGATGGGTVLVGGDWQGGAIPLSSLRGLDEAAAIQASTQQATTATMSAGATIDASATAQGDGGKVVLWSDVKNPVSNTVVAGTVFAKGGAQGGNGGKVETSGHNVDIEGFKVDTLATSKALGKTGLWLIDPYDYTIDTAQAGTIGGNLNTSDVTVTTTANNTGYGSNGNSASSGNITVNSAIGKTGSATTTLTLEADNKIDILGNVGTSGGALNLVLSTGAGQGVVSGTLSLGSGSLTKQGAGTLALTAANSYTGGTTVSAGTLGLYHNTAAGTGAIGLGNNTTVLLGRAITQIANDWSLSGTATIQLDTAADILVVGGGGGGGTRAGGGGGAGGVVQGEILNWNNLYQLTVGAGGSGAGACATGGACTAPTAGTTSSIGLGGIFWLTQAFGGAYGGGYVSGSTLAGGTGNGSGGGGGGNGSLGGYGSTYGTDKSSGTAGGNSTTTTGGGGGAAGIDSSHYAYSSNSTTAGAGGAGTVSSITGSAQTYGGGGGGGAYTGLPAGAGGAGGGGAGGSASAGSNATANSGGGGGGGGYDASQNYAGGAGGSGLIVVRYLGGTAAAGGTSSAGTGSASGYTLHTFSTAGTYSLTMSPVTASLSGQISGSGHLKLNATSTLGTIGTGSTITLAGNNTYTGSTTIVGGTVTTAHAQAMGSHTAVTVQSGSSLQLQNTLTAGSMAGNGDLKLGAYTLTTGGDNTSTSYAGTISGTGSLLKAGTGTWTLSGSNTFSGGATVNDGTLSVSADANLGAVPGSPTANALVLDGGTLLTTANFTLDSNRGLQLSASGGTLNVASGTALAYGGVLNGSGNVGKLGAGTLTLSGSNTFTGNTTVSEGTLSVDADANLGAVPSAPTANALVLDGGTLATTASFALGSNRGLQLGASGGALNVASGTTLSYGGVLSGSGNLGKFGAGTLSLSGSNTYTGNTTVSAGTLSVSADDNLGAVPNAATANALVLDGGTLATTASFSLGSNRGLQLGASGGALNVASGTALAYGGVLNGSGNLGKLGAGTLSLSGSNTFTGNTTVSAGTLSVSADANLGAVPGTATANALVLNGGTLLATADFTLANNRGLQLGGSGGTVNVASGYTLTYGGAINGSGSFHLNPLGTGTLLLTGKNSYTGQTTIAAGELVFESNAPTLTSSDFTGPGTLVVRSAAASFSSPWTWSATTLSLGHLRLGRSGNTQTITLANGIDLTGNLLVNGPSQLGDYINTGGSQTYMGDVSISSPSVALNGKTDGTTGAGLVFAGNINGTTANSNSLFLHSGAGDISVAGHVGTGIALNALYLGGAGTLLPALTVNFAYTGEVQTFTAPRAGTYTLSTWGAAGGGLSYDVNSRAKGGYATGTYAMNAGDTLYVVVGGQGGDSLDYKSTYGGYNGGGSSHWQFTNGAGPAGGGGATHIATASGVLNSLAASSASVLLVAGGGGGWSVTTSGTTGGSVPSYSNTFGLGSSSPTYMTESAGGGGGYLGGGIHVNFKSVQAGMYIYNYGKAYGGTSYVNATLGSQTLTAGAGSSGDGSARIAIAGSSSFTEGHQTGTITISGGLNVSQLNTASTMTGKLTLAGSSGNVAVAAPVTFNNTGPLQLGTSSGASQSVAITGALVATAPSLVQLGAGVSTSTASSAQSYGAVQLLRDVTLSTSNSALSFASTVDGSTADTESLTVSTGTSNTIFSGAVGGSTALKDLTVTTRTLTAAAIEASGLITITRSSASTISGVISGSTGLTLAGSSTLTLSGDNSYSGTTTISGGTLRVGSGGTTGTLGTGAVIDNAALVFNRSDTLTVANAISGTGSLTQSGSGTLVLTGSNSYGTTTISGGTLQVGNGGSSGTLGTGAVSNATALVFNRSGSLTVENAISGAGSLSQNGSGTLTLTQNNSYTGTTTINNGVLVLANDASNPANKTFAGTGQLRIEPAGNDFTGAFSTSGWSFASTLSGLTIGKASSADGTTDQAVSIDAATSIAGPIALYGGNIAVNAGLVSTGTGFGAMVTLKGSGTVSDGPSGYIQTSATGAGNLLLLGGNVTLDSSSNSTWVLAASGVSGLTWLNSQQLFIGSLSGVNGVSASGVVNIGTQTGPLVIGQSVATSNTSSTALTLNASVGSSVGSDLDKNIAIPDGSNPIISVGSGGVARLLTGGVAGSTALAGMNGLGAGSGRFRYNSDEGTTSYSTALKTGLNVIYREQPTASVSSLTLGMTYGDALPGMTGTGMVNGDGSSGYTISSPSYSASGNLQASASSYTITPTLAALGYSVSAGSVTTGTLSVAKANATVTANSGTLTYNGANQTVSGFTASGLVGDETAAVLTGVSASLTQKNAGTYTVTPSGSDTNYNLSFVNGAMLIQPAPLTVTANNASKTYDAQPYSGGNGVSYSGFVGGESATALGGTVSYGGTAQGATNAGSGYTLTPSGLSSNNYDITYVGGTLAIIPAVISGALQGAVNKVYDSTMAATLDTANYALTGWVGQDGATVTKTSGTYDNANASSSKTVTVALSASDYSVMGTTNLTNYSLPTSISGAVGTISQAALTINATQVTKPYDGTLSAPGAGQVGPLATGDVINFTGTQAFTNKNVGSGDRTVIASGVTIKNGATNADVTGNYAITYVSNTTSTITPKALFISGITAADKVYDGQSDAVVSSAGVTAAVLQAGGLIAGDDVRVAATGKFRNVSNTADDKNVGANKTVALTTNYSGTDVGNYAITHQATTTASITAKAVTLSAPTASRVYDGSTLYMASATDMAALSAALGVSGDTVSSITLNYDNKNVGNGKTLTASGAVISDGNGGSNYTITYATNTQSSVSRLNSVSWVGLGSTNNWFDPANWAGGAVPDLSNVANVVIPSGVNVSFDTAGAVSPSDISAAVSLNSIGTQGSLTQANGTLNIGTGGMILASYTQNGGTLTNAGTTALGSFSQSGGSFTGTGNISTGTLVQTGGTLSAGGNLTVTDGFSQDTSGSVSVAGITSITDTSGSVQLGNLSSTGTLTVTSTDGVIKQAAGTALTASVTSSFAASTGTNPALPADVLLTNSNNLVGAVSATAANLSLTNAQALTLGTVNATGDLTVISAGALDMGASTVGGNLSADSGNGNITQAGALTVGGTSNLQAGTGNITLLNTGNDFTGAVSAGGNDVQIYDKNALTLGTVSTTGNLAVTSNGALDLGTSTIGGNLSATSGNGYITQAGALTVGGTSNLQAGTGNITLLNTGNDFTGAVSAGGNVIQIDDKNALSLGTVNATGGLTVTSNGDLNLGTSTVGGNVSANSGNGNITQGGALTVGDTGNLQAGTGNITLLNAGNDFSGAISAGGNVVQIYDKNALTLGNVSVNDDLQVIAGGNINQDNANAQKIVVDGATSLTADGRVVLDGRDNKFTKGVTVKAGSYTIEGDKRKSAGEAISKVMGSLPAAPSPATSLPNTQPPQPLVMTSSAATANSGSSGGSASGTGTATGSANSAGVSVKALGMGQQDTPLMVAVSLPKGVSTVGAGFSFELPESVKMMATQDSITQITLPNGSPLPSWLKFDPLGMRFEASAVPDSALPLQVLAMIAGQRVTVVISERTE